MGKTPQQPRYGKTTKSTCDLGECHTFSVGCINGVVCGGLEYVSCQKSYRLRPV